MVCAICETRRPRRFCPGVNGEICSICCGTEREVTVNCPLSCEYLQEARRREQRSAVPAELPNRDIQVTERLIKQNVDLLNLLGSTLLRAALETGAIDADAREALGALVRTYRTLESGVYYDTRPAGSFASAIYDALQNAATEFRTREHQELGVTRTRDADVLGLVVFLEQVEVDRSNDRPRGRAFIDWLRRYYEASSEPVPAERSSLFLP